MAKREYEKLVQTENRWITFRPGNELYDLLDQAAAKANSTRSVIVRMILQEALLKKSAANLDLQLETMRMTSQTIKRATSHVLKEVSARLPEILKEVGVELDA
jgi:metal-responsive CopG/Arc/MetJ family transcriptional regulator